jgi:hypothetical protein
MPGGMVLSLMNPKSLTTRSLNHMKLRSPGDLNRPEWRAVAESRSATPTPM